MDVPERVSLRPTIRHAEIIQKAIDKGIAKGYDSVLSLAIECLNDKYKLVTT